MVTEIPTYLNNIQHFPLKAVSDVRSITKNQFKNSIFLLFQSGFVSALPYLLYFIFSTLTGWLADWLKKSGKLSLTNVRRLFNSIAFMGPAIGLICLSFVGCDKTQAIIWLCLSVSLNGAVNSGFQVNHVEMSPNYAGTLFGITNMLANLTGFITPAVAGNITNFNVK